MKVPSLAAFLLLPLALSGCGAVPEQPCSFRPDAIEYRWDGDVVVANLTVTNRANFTAGLRTSGIDLQEWTAYDPGSEKLTLTKFLKNIDGPSQVFAPGETARVEVRLETHTMFRDKEGYYILVVKFCSALVGMEELEYNTGCFNVDTPEFYGKRADGPDCVYWDCSGVEFTGNARPDHRRPADCPLTPHTGP